MLNHKFRYVSAVIYRLIETLGLYLILSVVSKFITGRLSSAVATIYFAFYVIFIGLQIYISRRNFIVIHNRLRYYILNGITLFIMALVLWGSMMLQGSVFDYVSALFLSPKIVFEDIVILSNREVFIIFIAIEALIMLVSPVGLGDVIFIIQQRLQNQTEVMDGNDWSYAMGYNNIKNTFETIEQDDNEPEENTDETPEDKTEE